MLLEKVVLLLLLLLCIQLLLLALDNPLGMGIDLLIFEIKTLKAIRTRLPTGKWLDGLVALGLVEVLEHRGHE